MAFSWSFSAPHIHTLNEQDRPSLTPTLPPTLYSINSQGSSLNALHLSFLHPFFLHLSPKQTHINPHIPLSIVHSYSLLVYSVNVTSWNLSCSIFLFLYQHTWEWVIDKEKQIIHLTVPEATAQAWETTAGDSSILFHIAAYEGRTMSTCEIEETPGPALLSKVPLAVYSLYS